MAEKNMVMQAEMHLRCGVYGEGVVCSVNVPRGVEVSALKEAIYKKNGFRKRFTFSAPYLKLYLARKKEGNETKWLVDNDDLDALLLGDVDKQFVMMRPSCNVDDENYFGKDFQTGDNEIHVLVELPEEANRGGKANTTLDKKQRLVTKCIPLEGPVNNDHYTVPFDTIDAFRQIKDGLSRKPSVDNPLFLLHGPRQFGKTSIALQIADWIEMEVKCVYFEMNDEVVETEEAFWNQLGTYIDDRHPCYDCESLMRLVEDTAIREQRQLCLIVDEMDHLFSNEELANTFLLALQKWKTAAYFRGFLGIGSHELVHRHEIFCRDNKTSPFEVGNIIRTVPFTAEQMKTFFKRIYPYYEFSQSLQNGIAKYSSGAPGVFGSLVRFAVDSENWTLEWFDWQPWFNLGAFFTYLPQYNKSYIRIQSDLRSLTALEWEALKYILEGNGKLTASTVEEYCGIAVGDQESRLVGTLLRMGIVVQECSGELSIVSELMRRACIEALPERNIHEAASTDDPVLLLSVALRHVFPKVISNHLVQNRHAPSEAVFHHELYSTIRDILKKGSLASDVPAEVLSPGSRKGADILILNGVRIAYELKSNLLRMSEIQAAAKQADKYRQQFKVDRILVVNFVPFDNTLDKVYGFKNIKFVHVRFADSCDQFSIRFLGENNKVKQYSVDCFSA